jgi:hypothetical protein
MFFRLMGAQRSWRQYTFHQRVIAADTVTKLGDFEPGAWQQCQKDFRVIDLLLPFATQAK